MKIEKKIFICAFLVLMLLLCVNAASASDSFDTDLTDDVGEDILLASDEGDVLNGNGDTFYVDSSYTGDVEQGTQDNPYKTISGAVGNATGGETIFIKNGDYSESNTIVFSKSLSIVGESQDGVKITGAAKSLFNAVEPALVLSFNNLTILNAGGGSNAAMKFTYSEHDLSITNCTFDSCGSKWGSIQLGAPGTAVIDNCKILNSKATVSASASAIYISGAGNFEIKNTLIDSAEYTVASSYTYGAIYIYNAKANVTMDNVTIRNTTGTSRGVIYNCGKLNISNSKIEKSNLTKFNTQTNNIITVANNAVLNVEQTEIIDNICVDNIISNVGDNSKSTLNYNNIQNNSANGTVNSAGTFDLEDNYWGSNTLPEGVSATVWVVEENGAYKLSNGNELEKEIPGIDSGSGVEPTPVKAIYVDSVNGLDTNDGTTEATAVKTIETAVELAEDEYETIIIKEGTYVENPITVEFDVAFITTGPVIWDANGKKTLYVKYSDVSLANITFINGNDTYNGAVIRQEYGSVTIDNCKFINNGGENRQALIQNKYGDLTITNTVFDKNTATPTGTSYGNIYVSEGTLYIDNCNFTNNYNKYGVLYITSSIATIYNSSFIGNNATSSSGGLGAGIYVGGTSTSSYSAGKGSTALIKNCDFINNTARGNIGSYSNSAGQGGAIYVNNNATVIIEDSYFENNVAESAGDKIGQGGAIFTSAGNTTVTRSVFKDNVAEEGSEVYVKYYSGTSSSPIPEGVLNALDIKDSIIDDDSESVMFSTDAKFAVNVNENYWSSNDKPTKVSDNINVDNWVIMDVNVDPENAQIGDKITITASFDKLQSDDGVSEYTGKLPDGLKVTFTSTSGNLNETEDVQNGVASLSYIIDEKDDAVTVGDVEIPLVAGVIFVSPEGNDANNGTEDDPVATIAHAIEISKKGKIVLLEGVHKTGNLGSINKDLTITGKGDAVIDAQNNNRVLYVGSSANIVLENVKLINGYTPASESGALIGNSGNLTIVNCILANSTSSKNGGAIYNAGYLTVIDSTFENNKASENGGAIFTQNSNTGKVPTLTITNSVFTDNGAAGSSNYGGGAVYVQSAADGVSISGSNFTSNYVERYGGGAIEIVNTNVATITGCNFVSNSAKGEDSDSNYGGGAISFIGAYSDKKETLTITDSLFEGNTVDGVGGGAVYVRAATASVSNSVLVNNFDDNDLAIYARVTSYVTPSVTANDNWWGSSDSPKDLVSNKVTLNRWAVLTVSNDTEFKAGENVTISANINSYSTGSATGELAKPITVPREVTIETSKGTIAGELDNGEFSYVLEVPEGLKYVEVSVDDQSEMLYLVSTETIVQVDNITAKKGQRPVYTINVTSSDGTIVNQGEVQLFIDDNLIATLDVENGAASYKTVVSLNKGTYDIVAKYTDEAGLFEENFGTATLTVSGTDNYITNANFFDFFDEDGYMYTDIPYTSLSFKENYDAATLGIDKITITAPMTFSRYSMSSAVFNNITFDIKSDGVTLTRPTINLDGGISGPAINVEGDGVTLNYVTINYETVNDTDAFGINVFESDNVKISNPTINFESNSIGTPGYNQYAIKIADSTNVVVSGGKINAKLPACDVDYSSQGIDADLILVIGAQDSENVTITNNVITTDVTDTHGSFPTVDSIMANSVTNLVISKNTITQTDFSTAGAGYSNVVDLYSCDYAQVLDNTILVNSTAGVDGAGTAYPIQLTGPYTGLLIDGNTLTSISCGPTLGIYSQNYAGATDITVTNNFINVTGYATNSSAWSLVSGMELQDTQAKIYNNTVYSQSTAPFHESNNLFGISYAQWLYDDHTFDIRDNAVFTEGTYAVYFLNAVNSNVIGNNLHGHELWGDDAAIIKDGSNNVIRNNMPPYSAEVIIDAPNAFKGYEYVITVTVTNATEGNVTIKVNDKEFKDLQIVNGTVSQVVDFADLVDDINNVTAIYAGSEIVNPGEANTTFIIVDGVITNATFHNYFDENGYLLPVPEGAILDFQGPFISANYTVYINQPVNIITTLPTRSNYENYTGPAVFDSGENPNRNWVKFNVIEGADYTNVTGLRFINAPIFVTGASHVTFDDIYTIANMSGVGSGTGFVCFRSGAEYGVVKNSYLQNAGNGGSSVIVAGKGAPYLTIDNNIVNITGNSGNILSGNVYVSGAVGDMPTGMRVTNNYIYNILPASGIRYCIAIIGSNNLIENNTIHHNGAGIVSAYSAESYNNTYRNNTLTGTATFVVLANSLAENNNVEGTMTVNANSVVTDNTVGAMTISGANAVVENNTVNGAVSLAAAAKNTTFTGNDVSGAVTVSSNDNRITFNSVKSGTEYAIDLKSTSNNVVTDNKLASSSRLGDEAVSYVEGNNNTVVRNGGSPIISIDVENVFIGSNNTIAISVFNATGNVTVKVNNKEFKELKLDNGALTINVDASDIVEGVNNVTVIYNGDEFINVGDETATFIGLGNVVTEDIFYEYFDEYGFLSEDVPFDELVFKGTFNKLSYYIILDRPITITGQDAILKDIAIIIDSSDVKLDNMTLQSTMALGSLIAISESDVSISNINISYKVNKDDSVAIDITSVDNVNVTGCNVYVETHITEDTSSASAINVDKSSNVLIDGNVFETSFPALYASNYDWDYMMMGLNTVNPIRIRASQDIKFTNNMVNSSVNDMSASYPTIQSVFVVGSTNVLIDGNDFYMIDEVSTPGKTSYLYAVNFGYDKNITVSNNNFNMFTLGGIDSNGAAYALQGVESQIDVIGNNITSISNGPNLGFYVTSMMGGSSEVYVAKNIFNITGNATSSAQWALVSGVEITNGNAKVYDNTIYTYNKAGYVEIAPVHGVSYGQYMYGTRSADVQNNTMYIQGKYTVSFLEGTAANVTGNILYAEELFGDDSVAPGIVGIVKDNMPPFNVDMIIDGQTVWIGQNSTITVTVPNGTGNVTIKIGNSTFDELKLINGTVTQAVDAADLVAGANNITVTYNGDSYIFPSNATGNLQVIDGVITNETFEYYFDTDNGNYLFDYVPEGVTLDFQGPFIGAKYSVYINKPENIVSTTDDAVFDSGANPNRNWVKFNVVAGGDHTNITGISIINGDLFIQGASYVTVDDIYMKANMSGVGSGTGFLSIHSEAYYTTIKNSFFENGGTGSSCVVLGKGGKYATFDNNKFEITGSSGNVLSSNVFVGSGELPQFVNYTNNEINSHVAGSSFMYGITVCGEGNIIENNSLINFKGNGIINQYGATSTKNIYRNNTITGGGSMQIGTYSLVENNNVAEGALTVTEGCTFINNTAKSLTISGKNVNATENTVLTTVTINAAASNTTFVNNIVDGLVTVNSNLNTITDNLIIANSEYAVDLKSTANNTVSNNILYGNELVGDAAVKYVEDKDNTVENNYPIDPVLVVEAEDITVGETAIINISFNENVTGNVEVIIDGKKYTVAINEGKGQLNVSDLFAGKFTASASFDGSLMFIPTENSTVFTVNKLDATANITISEPALGENATVTFELPNSTGTVTVKVDGKEVETVPVANGTATVTVPDLAAGNHVVEVAYSGDDVYAPVSETKEITVGKQAADIEANGSEITEGETATIAVTVPSDATGFVLVDVAGNKYYADVVDGQATVNIAGLAAGNYSATVVYMGDDKFNNASASAAIVVNAIPEPVVPAVNITIPSDVGVGDSPVIKVDVPADATGNVTVKVDGKLVDSVPVTNGTATVTVPDIAAGNHVVEVAYSGDDVYAPVSETKELAVDKQTAAIEANGSEITEGDVATITVTVPSDATGVVLVDLGELKFYAPIKDGKATVNAAGLKAGNYTANIKYVGNLEYDSATTTATVIVTPIYEPVVPTVEITVPSNISAGDAPTVKVDLPADATGNVTVKVDGKVVDSVPVANGTASVPLSALGGGTHAIEVAYSGDDKYAPTNAINSITAEVINTTIEAEATVTRYANDYAAGERGILLTGVLKDANGNVIANKTCYVAVNGPIYTAPKDNNTITDENGIFGVQVNLNTANTYTYALVYLGDDNYKASMNCTKLILEKKPVTLTAAAKTFKASAKTKKITVNMKTIANAYDGKTYLSGGKTITLKLNGVTYTAKTNANGVATFNVKITKKGTFTGAISFAGDKTYNSATGKVTVKIT